MTAAQLVLARRHGFTSWARLRRYVQIVTARAWTPGQPPPDDGSGGGFGTLRVRSGA